MPRGDFGGRPPTADDVLRALRRNMPMIVLVAVGLLVALVLLTVFYRVDASDQGVVLRFGKHVRTTEPGLHTKMPWPIERVYNVPVRRIQTLEFGFETEEPGRVTAFVPTGPEHLDVSEMLSGDLNLANVKWVVQYRVKDPAAYLFNIGDVEGIRPQALPSGVRSDPNAAVPDMIRDVSESVVRKLVGDTSVDAVLTFGRETIADDAKREIQKMLDGVHSDMDVLESDGGPQSDIESSESKKKGLESGIEIVTVKLQSTAPPEEVKDAFQEVNRARQNKERVVNEAEGERNSQIPAARGQRDKAISEAEGYMAKIKMTTEGKIKAFLDQLTEYEKAPEVTRTRLYLEAMEEVLGAVDQKTIVDDSMNGVLPLLNLDQAGSSSITGEGGAR